MRSVIVATVLALSTLIGTSAFAEPDARGERHATGRSEGSERTTFPMPATDFKAKVDARQARGRTHMEARAAKLQAEPAKQLRARFETRVQKVNVEVAKAIADGTVTREEAQAVRAAHPHHRHGGRHHAGDQRPAR